jgi:RNA polymerase sigma factor (sigma-70 family)
MPPPAHGIASRPIAGPTLRTQSDRRLVGLVREGYEVAFEEIVRRYGRQLGRYATAIVGGRSEDVTQDAFSKALLALRRDDDEIELRPWLYRIVRNTALNDLRDRPPAAVELAEAIAAGSNPADALEQREELTHLMERLRALPEAQRAAIVMRELEGLSHEEIAAALGMSGGAARQAIYRARRTLRDAAGMLVPLPLLRALLADGPAAAEAAGGAAGVAGAGIAVKATAATVLVAGTVGAGVALQEERGDKEPKARAGAVARKSPSKATAGPLSPLVTVDDSGGGPGPDSGPSGSSGSSGEGRSERESREGPSGPDSSGPGRGGSVDDPEEADDGAEDRSGPGDGSDGASSGSGSESGSRSGSGSGSDSGTESGASSGPGSGFSPGSGSGSGGDSLSSGSSTSSGSGSSGSGSSESTDSGTSGSSLSGSGSSGTSDSSGSGSGSGSEPTYELDSDDD